MLAALPLLLLMAEANHPHLALPPAYDELARLAQSAPAAIAADTWLWIAESGNVSNKDAKKDLIEHAFAVAASAQLRMPFRGSAPDTPAGMLVAASKLGLDALTLQSRAVVDMIALDPRRAREMFQGIGTPEVKPLSCSDRAVTEVGAYYAALGALISSAFTREERARGDAAGLLIGVLSRIGSPVELTPALKLAAAAGRTPDERASVLSRLASILETLSADDRTYSLTIDALSAATPAELKPALAKYRERQGGATHCQAPGQTASASIGGAQAPAAQEQEDAYWQTPTARHILELGQRLRFSPGNIALSAAERSTPEWKQRLTEFLDQVDAWPAAGERSETDYFNERAIVYEALIELMPVGADRDKVIDAFASFLSGSDAQRTAPATWYMHAHTAVERVRRSGGDTSALFKAFAESGNPALTLYATRERLVSGAAVP